jgi:hypothetical protein
MNYPEHLIPSPIFKRIETNLDGYFISRTFPSKNSLHGTDYLIDEAVLLEDPLELFDYSTNLIGHFQLDDNYLQLIGDHKTYFRAYWDFIEEVQTPKYLVDFEVDNNKGIFFLNISQLHQKIVIPFNIKGSLQSDHATANVIHTPTRSNFWHFSIIWKKDSGEIIRKSDARWKYLLTTSMKSFLMELMITDHPNYKPLPKAHFLRE